MDAHPPRTSHTGRLHGMPLAWLLGEDDDPLYGLATGVIEPRHVALIGVRSFEPEEQVRLDHLGVRVLYMDEIRTRGIAAGADGGVPPANRGPPGLGLSNRPRAVAHPQAPGA